MSRPLFNQAVTPISQFKFVPFLFLGCTIFNFCSLGRDCLSVLSHPEEDFQPFTLSSLDLPTNSIVTFFSPISSLSKIPSKPAALDETPASTLPSTSHPPTIIPDVARYASTGLQSSISLPGTNQSEHTQELRLFSSLLSDVRPLLPRPNHLKMQPNQSAFGRQHRREIYTNHSRRTKGPRFNQHLHCCVKPVICKCEKTFWYSKHQEYTVQSTSLPSQRLVVPPQTITELPRWCRWNL